MHITIKALGKISNNLQNIYNNYLKRLKLLKINILENNSNSVDWLFNNLENTYSIVLSEDGINYSSVDFSKFLFSLPNSGISKACFIIGGANGISNEYKKKASISISFGKLTFPHELFRVLLIEQLYRAETIYLNHPYHK